MSDSRKIGTRAPPRILLLGTFAVMVDNAEVFLPTNAQRVLVGLCIVGRPRLPQSRAALAERVWAASPAKRAQGNLRTALWRIRQVDRWLVSAAHDQVRLGPLVRVDVHESLAQAERLLRQEEQLERDDERLDPLTLDLLPGWDEEWLILERERVRQTRLHALEALSSRLLADGRYGLAVQAALASIAAEPLRESAHYALIAAELGEGNYAAAHRDFRRYCELLWDELRLTPAVGFQELLARHSPRRGEVPLGSG
ncbi:BTAD domain-containing putative transcriptional regulator [Streptomyces sp. SID13031]|uniref:AfsR/SARP family transcriptional regulator n=1 Tax=Streptomyces sp. SID13031 TaxID=2706046 RepID=UPI0013CA4BDA|nr:BTAD domain-containing putative transcriptional regulator [Streptomyces sp. SID13031]NEA33393.1 SARP family transcriptional regulator [Streptomyces sp. SID13031]